MTPIRKSGVAAGLTVWLLFCAWVFVYLSGLFPYLGYKSMTEGFVPMARTNFPYSSSRGLDAWQETFLFFEGQQVFIDYTVEIRSGSLWLFVRPWAPFPDVWDRATQLRVTANGHGRLTHRVARTGLYSVAAQPSNASGPGSAYDVTYTAAWGATWGGE